MSRTTKARLKGMLRQIWLRSNERAEALKRDKYSCCKCGVKKSVKKGCEVKVEVHHKKGVLNWDKIIDLILEELLCNPENLETLCKECHDKETFK
jgi:5-methylcytosine-specific restriction endonuclease McrA